MIEKRETKARLYRIRVQWLMESFVAIMAMIGRPRVIESLGSYFAIEQPGWHNWQPRPAPSRPSYFGLGVHHHAGRDPTRSLVTSGKTAILSRTGRRRQLWQSVYGHDFIEPLRRARSTDRDMVSLRDPI